MKNNEHIGSFASDFKCGVTMTEPVLKIAPSEIWFNLTDTGELKLVATVERIRELADEGNAYCKLALMSIEVREDIKPLLALLRAHDNNNIVDEFVAKYPTCK